MHLSPAGSTGRGDNLEPRARVCAHELADRPDVHANGVSSGPRGQVSVGSVAVNRPILGASLAGVTLGPFLP